MPFLSIFTIAYLYLPRATYIFALFRLNYPYLIIFALNGPNLPYMYVLYSPKICILLLRQLFMEILHLKEFEDAESVDMQFGCLSSL